MAVSYDIKNKALWLDLEDILYPKKDEGPRDNSYTYRLVIHTPTEDIDVYKFEAKDTSRDYVQNVAEFMLVRCYITAGVYLKKIAQYREMLEASIYKIPIKTGSGIVRTDKQRTVSRYRAIFRTDLNKIDSGTEASMLSASAKDLSGVPMIFFELHSRQFEALMIKTTSGTYQKIPYEDMIRAIITSESNKVTIAGKPALDAIDIYPPDNKKPNNCTIIPSLTPITSFPTFLQEQMNGVYAFGIGNFFQNYRGKNTWFVYPLYNVNRFEEDVYKAVFYSLPANVYGGIDRTYVENGKTLKIAVGGQKSYRDNAELGMINDGAGIRMSDQSAMMKKPWTIDGDKGPKGQSNKLNNEFIVKDRSDGLNYAKYRKNDSTSNPFHESSRVAYHQTAEVVLEWQNGDIELLYPGMPIKYVFIEEGNRREVKGTLLNAYEVVANQSATVGASGHFMTTVVVCLAVQPYRRKGIDK